MLTVRRKRTFAAYEYSHADFATNPIPGVTERQNEFSGDWTGIVTTNSAEIPEGCYVVEPETENPQVYDAATFLETFEEVE